MTRDIGAEVRVHGIGNHGPLSALGSPKRRHGGFLGVKDDDAALVTAPMPKGRSLWLVAWTRSSRTRNSFTWYLGLAFTLCNTAGHMRPPGRGGALVNLAAGVFGSLLTVGAFLWSVVAAETLYFKLRVPDTILGLDVPAVTIVLVTAIWVVLLGRRAARHGFAKGSRELDVSAQVLAMVHLAAVVGAALSVWWVAPAQAPSGGQGPCWGDDIGPCLVANNDWATLMGWATIALAGLLVFLFSLASLAGGGRNWIDRSTFPLLGSGLAFLISALLLHVLASVVVLLLDWLGSYASAKNPWRPDSWGAIPHLRAYDQPDLIFTGSDTIAAAWAPFGWAVLLLLVVLRIRTRFVTDSHEKRARLVHRLVTEPGSTSYPLIVAALTIAGTLMLYFVLGALDQVQFAGRGARDPQGWDEFVRLLAVVGMHVGIVVVPFVFLSRDVRSTIAVLSDVVGYWPIRHHPLAAPPYRFEVVEKAASEIAELDGRVVVVGHSQGSVLALDIVDEIVGGSPQTSVGLITCGSPLSSLYSTYFPTAFPLSKRDGIAQRVTWINCWRRTDPISTQVWTSAPIRSEARAAGSTGTGIATPGIQHVTNLLEHRDVEIEDGGARTDGSRVLRVHGDYWWEEKQERAVEEFLRSSRES